MFNLRQWPALLLLTCCAPDLSPEEEERLRTMAAYPSQIPDSPTNAYADDPAAAELGRFLFFDPRMSSDEQVACASCHDPKKGFSDDDALSAGARDRLGQRHSMPVIHSATQRFLLWDGRADSLWSQSLKAIENEVEMDFTRLEVVHFVARYYASDYEAVFGPLPNLAGLPPRGRPGTSAWSELDVARQDEANRVFTNVGKAIEAYERRVLCLDTRFDQWANGESELSMLEREGAAQFIRQRCIECHSGPSFSDGKFHNIGLGSGRPTPDRGRQDGVRLLLEDLFNGAGPYSDDRKAGRDKLDAIASETRQLGAFKTPSLRGVGQRGAFGHRGHLTRLESFLGLYDGPKLEASAVGRIDPLLNDIDLEDTEAVAAFLRTLDCSPLPRAFLDPFDESER